MHVQAANLSLREVKGQLAEIEIVLSETSSVYKGANCLALIKAQILSSTEKNQLSRRLGVYIKESRIKSTH